jgi:hypothetical protein
MSLPTKEEVVSQLLQKMLSHRIVNLEQKQKDFTNSVEFCKEMVKTVTKTESSNNSYNQINFEEKRMLSRMPSKSRLKMLTPLRKTRKSVSKDKTKPVETGTVKKEKTAINIKLNHIVKPFKETDSSTTARNKVKSPIKDLTVDADHITKEEGFESFRCELKSSHTLKTLVGNKSKIKNKTESVKTLTINKLIKPSPLKIEERRIFYQPLKSPKTLAVPINKTMHSAMKSSQLIKKEKSKIISSNESNNKCKISYDKSMKRLELKQVSTKVENKYLLSKFACN